MPAVSHSPGGGLKVKYSLEGQVFQHWIPEVILGGGSGSLAGGPGVL